MISANQARIDICALKHNLRRVRQHVGQAKIIVVIKANAYGHGMLRVAQALKGVDALAVANIKEAIALRKVNVEDRILVLQGFISSDELSLIERHRLDTVIHHPDQIDLLEKTKLAKPIVVWLKIDTGMHRLGIDHSISVSALRRVSECRNTKQIVLMSHLASADDVANPYTEQQIRLFESLYQPFDLAASLANSAGILGFPRSHFDWVRPGIMLYGISPFHGGDGRSLDLRPVMTLMSRVIAINPIKKGELLGYGGTWQADQATRIAVISIGYGDGYPRQVSNGTPVLIRQRRFPIVGRVSMDMTCVDIGDSPIQVGEQVTLWGEGLPVEEIASRANTIAYELVCKLTQRVQFTSINEN